MWRCRWATTSGAALLELPEQVGPGEEAGNGGPVLTLAFSPDGRRLASGGSDDGTAHVWDLDSGRDLLTLVGHREPVESVAFSPDGGTLATASDDATTAVYRVAWSPDGHRLATASRDGTSRVYLVELDDLVDLARSKVTRGLTAEECQKFLHQDPCPN